MRRSALVLSLLVACGPSATPTPPARSPDDAPPAATASGSATVAVAAPTSTSPVPASTEAPAQPPAADLPPPQKQSTGAIPKDAAYLGPAAAPVTIQVFSDFQCPYCRDMDQLLSELRAKYGDRVRVVWRDFPLDMHRYSRLAAMAAREAYAQKGNDGFWAMREKLFAGQEKDEGLGPVAVNRYAKEIGLDTGRFSAAIVGKTHLKRIEKELAVAAALDLKGTPSVFVNDYVAFGESASKEGLMRLVDLALSEKH
ncbi:MAG: thioredoxin domain-containing protein [Polyangiaceae bacterium]|nr:thioredoxin domain-containing protein [Polyangiaceae bacterium]